MFVLALANYSLMYAANILLARSLTVDDFDDYSVALSIVTMLSTLATLGLEKYALRNPYSDGTVGVAFAYMIPVVLLFIVFRIMAMLRFRRF